jgi:hypothetical protein
MPNALENAQAAVSAAALNRAVATARAQAARAESTAAMSRADRITHAGTVARLEGERRAAQGAQERAQQALAAARDLEAYESARHELTERWQNTPVPESGPGERNARTALGYGLDPLDVALADGDGERLLTLHLKSSRGINPPAGSIYLDHLEIAR